MGFLFKKKQEQKSNYDNKSSQTTTPVESPEWQAFADMLRKSIGGSLGGSSLPGGFEAAGVGNINNTWDLAKQGLSNNLTSRGLGRSPIAGNAMTQMDMGRAGDITQLQTETLPAMERQWKMEDLQNALNLFGQRSIGSSSTGTNVGNSLTKTTQTPSILDMILKGASGIAGFIG